LAQDAFSCARSYPANRTPQYPTMFLPLFVIGISIAVASSDEDAFADVASISLLQTAVHIAEEKSKQVAEDDLHFSDDDFQGPGNLGSDSVCNFGAADAEVPQEPTALLDDSVLLTKQVLSMDFSPTWNATEKPSPAAKMDIYPLCDETGEDCDYDESISYTDIGSMQMGVEVGM